MISSLGTICEATKARIAWSVQVVVVVFKEDQGDDGVHDPPCVMESHQGQTDD